MFTALFPASQSAVATPPSVGMRKRRDDNIHSRKVISSENVVSYFAKFLHPNQQRIETEMVGKSGEAGGRATKKGESGADSSQSFKVKLDKIYRDASFGLFVHACVSNQKSACFVYDSFEV